MFTTGFALAEFCAKNPTDPQCGSGPGWWQTLRTDTQYNMASTATGGGAAGAGDSATTGIGPDKIVTTTTMGTFWGRIPTWVKLAGAGVIAFVGYKKFIAKPKTAAQLSGHRRRW